MNDEPDPHHGEPTGGSRPAPQSQDAGGRALEQAKKVLTKGLAEFKRLDKLEQLYFGGLGVVVVFAMLFDVMSVEQNGSLDRSNYKYLVGHVGRGRSLAGAGNTGLLAFLCAVGGIGILFWNSRSPVKRSWVPMALAGCVGGSLLMMLLATRGVGVDFGGVYGISRSFLGFWVPFLGAAAALGASVKLILSARTKGPATRTPTPPPPPPIS